MPFGGLLSVGLRQARTEATGGACQDPLKVVVMSLPKPGIELCIKFYLDMRSLP